MTAKTATKERRLPVGPGTANARTIEREADWFARILDTRISLYFQQSADVPDIRAHEPPELAGDGSEYSRLIQECGLGFDERVILILALLPHVRPQALDTLFIRNKNLDRDFAEFGGRKGTIHAGFLPTIETAAFVLAGDDLSRRFDLYPLFERDHVFHRRGLLRIETPDNGDPAFSAALSVTDETLQRVTCGSIHEPDYSVSFPAKRTTTQLTWDDLVLAPEVMEEVENVTAWLQYGRTILDDWGLGRTLKPGYRSLFWGPPGTGKTLTATLIGATVGVPVYRIDLSMVVSKYIGETEKNLASVFDQAENRRWILFFDEADALFGRRTQAITSNDRHANQEVSYLLQRVEDFPGLVILATNLKANIDDAFARRFQSVIYFPMPDADLRLRLWRGVADSGCRLADDVDLDRLAARYELSGGAILNVVRHGAIRTLKSGREAVGNDDLLDGIRKEFRKEGRTL